MRIIGQTMPSNNGLRAKLKTKSEIHLTRKIWHFLGILIIAILYNNVSRQAALSWTLSLGVASLLFDFIRLHNSQFNNIFIKLAAPVLREREKTTYTGTTFLFFGTFIIVYIFPERIVQMSLIFLATADPIASFFGIKYGTDKIVGNKTLQGTIASFVCCTVIAVAFYTIEDLMTERILIVSLLTGVIGALSELIAIGKLDDNLTFPVLNSFFLWILFNIFGGL